MKKTIASFLTLILLLAACSSESASIKADVDTARSFSKYGLTYMAETEDTLYFYNKLRVSTNLIYYIDKDTGISGPLCGKPECKHDVSTCNAFTLTYSGEGPMYKVDGADGRAFGMSVLYDRLYWAVRTELEGVTIYSSALDGSDHRKMGCLGRDLTPNDTDNWSMVWSDRYAFFSCITTGVEDAVEVEHNYVCAIPLDSEAEPIVILSERTEYSYVVPMQVYGGYLYFITDNQTEAESFDFTIYRWNMETHELETVFEDPDSGIDHTYLLWVTDDYILFNNFDNAKKERVVYKYDFGTGECGLLLELGVPNTEGPLGSSFGYVDFADGIVVGSKLLSDETNSFRVVITNFDGNTLVDDTYRPEPGDGISAYQLKMNGADSENVYFTLYTNLDNSKTKVTFITVALNGSGARTLGTLELPGY